MRFQVVLAALLGWVSCTAATSNNLTDLVTWDKYSLTVNGTRVYIRLVLKQSFASMGTNTETALPNSTIRDYRCRNSGWYDLDHAGHLQVAVSNTCDPTGCLPQVQGQRVQHHQVDIAPQLVDQHH